MGEVLALGMPVRWESGGGWSSQALPGFFWPTCGFSMETGSGVLTRALWLSGCLMWQPASTRATAPTESGAGDAAFFPSGLAGREAWMSHSATFALLHWPKPVLVILILRALHSQ